MGNSNSTNDKIKDFFNRDVKDVFSKIGNIGGKFVQFGESMMQNMMKLGNNLDFTKHVFYVSIKEIFYFIIS